jgi:hypothetical protein
MAVLCGSALQFALDMRRTRAVYRIIVPRRGGLVDESPDSIMQETDMALQLAKEPTRMTFTLCAALVRLATGSNTESKVEVLRSRSQDAQLPA